MSIDKDQFRNLIIRPALQAINLNTEDAVELLMLTASTESKLGSYVRQVGVKEGIGAYGIFQIEKNTYDYMWNSVISIKPTTKAQIQLFCGYAGKPPVERLITDMALSVIVARLIYYNVPRILPSASNIRAMAEFYKIHYNSTLGENTVEHAINDYRKYAL